MQALGGRSRIEAIKTIMIEGTGVNYNLGQDMKPEAATQQFAITGYKREIDVEQGRQRIEQTRTPKFAYFQGPQPQTQIQVLDGDVAFNVSPSGSAARVGTGRRAGPPHRVLSSSRHRAEGGDRSADDHLEREDRRQRSTGGLRLQRSAVDDDHRCGGPAAIDLDQDRIIRISATW